MTNKVISISAQNGIYVSYEGFEDQWNEWIHPNSMPFRIAKHGTRTHHSHSNNKNGVNVFSCTKYGLSDKGKDIREFGSV